MKKIFSALVILALLYSSSCLAESQFYKQTTEKEIRFLDTEWGCSIERFKNILSSTYNVQSLSDYYYGYLEKEFENINWDYDVYGDTQFSVQQYRIHFTPFNQETGEFYSVAGYRLSSIDASFYLSNGTYNLFNAKYSLNCRDDSDADVGANPKDLLVSARADLIKKLSSLYGEPHMIEVSDIITVSLWIGQNQTAVYMILDNNDFFTPRFIDITYIDLSSKETLKEIETTGLNVEGL